MTRHDDILQIRLMDSHFQKENKYNIIIFKGIHATYGAQFTQITSSTL